MWRCLLLFALLVALSLATACSDSSDASTCASLGEVACIDSTSCTLVVASENPGDYVCVGARDSCDDGFAQRDGTADDCEAKDGCTFVPAECYCAPDVSCICGGGPPAQCRPDA